MRFCYVAFWVGLFPVSGYGTELPQKNTVTAKLATVGCTYHDVLWDRTGYDEAGRPTSEFLALDICRGIAQGQELELFENQLYAPGGLRIVRIEGKLYFVRVRDLEKENARANAADAQKEEAVKTADAKKD